MGSNGAGKGAACQYLASLGFSVWSLSDMVRDEVKRLGRPMDRDTLTATANEMKAAEGTIVLAERSYARCVAEFGLTEDGDSDISDDAKIVLDSIRHVSELRFLQDRGFVMLGVDAPLDQRFDRIRQRGKETDVVDFETFKRQDTRERDGSSFGQQIDDVLDACDTLIENDGSLPQFQKAIDFFLSDTFSYHPHSAQDASG